jgi:hypothetical protein
MWSYGLMVEPYCLNFLWFREKWRFNLNHVHSYQIQYIIFYFLFFFILQHALDSLVGLRCFLSCYQVVAGLWVISVIGSWFNFLTLFYLCKSSCINSIILLNVTCFMLKRLFYGILLTMSPFGEIQSIYHCLHCHWCMRKMKTRLMH